jgi:hypothetical protein
MNAQDTANNILVDSNAESQRDLLGYAGASWDYAVSIQRLLG